MPGSEVRVDVAVARVSVRSAVGAGSAGVCG